MLPTWQSKKNNVKIFLLVVLVVPMFSILHKKLIKPLEKSHRTVKIKKTVTYLTWEVRV